MAAACCCLLILAAATATSSNNTGAVDDRCLMMSFGPNDKIPLELDDVVHAVPRTQTTATRIRTDSRHLTIFWTKITPCYCYYYSKYLSHTITMALCTMWKACHGCWCADIRRYRELSRLNSCKSSICATYLYNYSFDHSKTPRDCTQNTYTNLICRKNHTSACEEIQCCSTHNINETFDTILQTADIHGKSLQSLTRHTCKPSRQWWDCVQTDVASSPPS